MNLYGNRKINLWNRRIRLYKSPISSHETSVIVWHLSYIIFYSIYFKFTLFYLFIFLYSIDFSICYSTYHNSPYLYFLFYLPWKFKRSYRQYKALHSNISIVINNLGISGNSDHGNFNFEWSIFKNFKENKDIFLIYHTDYLFHIIPKRCFDDTQDSIKISNLLHEKIK